MRRLQTRRASRGLADVRPEVPRMVLEGDPTDAPLDEGPVLVPFTAALPAAGWPVPPAPPPGAACSFPLSADPVPRGEDLLARAIEYERLGRRLDAMAVLRTLLAADPSRVEARLRLAHLHEAGGDQEEALGVLDAGLAAAGAPARLRVARGALLNRLGRHADAEAELRLALAAAEEERQRWEAEAELQLGVALLRRAQPAEAAAALERARARDPESAAVALHLGEAYAQVGDLPRAEEALRRAAALAPDDARPWSLLGRLLDRSGREAEAMAMHRRAREASVGRARREGTGPGEGSRGGGGGGRPR